MPDKRSLPYIQFIGGQDPKRMMKLKSILSVVGVPDKVKQIIVENSLGMNQARQMYGVSGNHPAFSLYNDGRVYIDRDTLDNPKMFHDYLLHEFGHFASGAYPKKGVEENLPPVQTQAMENQAEQGAKPFRDAYQFYLKNQKALDAKYAKYSLDSQAAKLPGEFEPTHVPPETQLTPPTPLLSPGSLLPHAHAAILGALGAASQPPVKQQ